MSSSGPAGTGLIPPSSRNGSHEERGSNRQDEDDQDMNPSDQDDRDDNQQDLSDDLIDGEPPVDEADGDHDDESQQTDDDEYIDLEEFERRIEDRMQKRFDRAISKMQRRIDRQSSRDDHDDDDSNDDDKSPRRSRSGRRSGQVDLASIRVLARDVVADQMDRSGTEERRAVRQMVDQMIPLVDWGQVDDQVDTIENLVETARKNAASLVKVGSDRKVAQLRNAGALPRREGQPSGRPSGTKRASTATRMDEGAKRAKVRFPNGKRSLYGRQ